MTKQATTTGARTTRKGGTRLESDTILIKLKYGTKLRLGSKGRYGESLDDIVNKILDFYEENHEKSAQ